MKLMKLNIQMFAQATMSITSSETDISKEDNTSYINVVISVTTASTTWNNTGTAYVEGTITGEHNTYSIPKTYFNISKGSTVTVYSGKIGPFTHNDDGTLNPITINANAYVVSGTTPSATSSCTMSTIARKSSVSANAGIIGGTTTILISRKSNTFTHTLTYTFGSLSGTIATGVGDSYVWTIPINFYNQIPNSKSGTCTITCSTYSGNTNIGSTSCTFTVSGNESACKPTLDAAIVDTNSTTVALTGDNSILVKGYSTASITTTATAKNGATISSVVINGINSSGNLVINKITSNTIVIVATDSRGYSNTYTKTIPMIDYVQLTCSAKFYRKTAAGNIVLCEYSGNYFNGTFGSISNSLELNWKYREKGSEEWLDGGILSPVFNGNTFSESFECEGDFDYQTSYEYIIYFKDKLISSDTGILPVTNGIASFEIYEDCVRINGVFIGIEIVDEWED